MLNQATINNMLNLNTFRRFVPKTVYDPAERRARLCLQVDEMAKRRGLDAPFQINNLVSIAVEKLNQNYSAASAYDEARKAADYMASQQGRPPC